MSWRLAKSLEQLRAEFNQLAPHRSVANDGTIGNQAHQARVSRHNPNKAGVVTGMDITHDPDHGCDVHDIARRIVAKPPLDLAYIISNGQVSSRDQGWTWRTYKVPKGGDKHLHHAHFGVGRGPDSAPVGPYDDTTPWGVAAMAKQVAQAAHPPTIFQETDMLRLLICNPDRDDWPEIKGHWFKSDGTKAGTEHVPTKGHATALKGLDLLKEDDPIPVSPSLLRELGAQPPKG